jgi:hypothetical protein
MACSYLYVGKGSALVHSVLVGLAAITLGTNIGVIFLMTRPFSSEWTIAPEGFEINARALRQFKANPPEVPPQTGAPERVQRESLQPERVQPERMQPERMQPQKMQSAKAQTRREQP